MRLGGITDHALTALLAHKLEISPLKLPSEIISVVAEQSSGNPLFALEVPTLPLLQLNSTASSY